MTKPSKSDCFSPAFVHAAPTEEMRKGRGMQMGVEIASGAEALVTPERQQILGTCLLSSYETAVQRIWS